MGSGAGPLPPPPAWLPAWPPPPWLRIERSTCAASRAVWRDAAEAKACGGGAPEEEAAAAAPSPAPGGVSSMLRRMASMSIISSSSTSKDLCTRRAWDMHGAGTVHARYMY